MRIYKAWLEAMRLKYARCDIKQQRALESALFVRLRTYQLTGKKYHSIRSVFFFKCNRHR